MTILSVVRLAIGLKRNFKMILIKKKTCHFYLNDYANKQNCRFCNEKNTHEIFETPLHSAKLCCGLWNGGINRSYFIQHEEENALRVNGKRYRSMVTYFFWPQWKKLIWKTCFSYTMVPHITLLEEPLIYWVKSFLKYEFLLMREIKEKLDNFEHLILFNEVIWSHWSMRTNRTQ